MRKKSIFDCLIYPFFVILLIHSTNGFTILPNPFNGQFIQQILMANTQQNTNFENPTNFAFLPDGRILVSEKLGKVKIITTSGSLDPQPWIDISNKVTSSGDRGLLGMAVHPDFQNNKYVYLLYSQRQVEGGTIESGEQAVQGRLVRYTEVDGYASMASEKVLIGATWGSGFPDCFDSHHVGTIHFGNDGSLLVSSGEGSHWDRPDWGQDTTAFDYQCAQLFGQDQDVGAFRAQMLDSLGGKVVRLDPETGLGIGTSDSKGRVANPFYDASAPASPKSLVWMYGLRNPFKFTVRMDTNVNNGHPGTLYIGDVGWDLWEETHVASEAGTNLGWPCYQGPVLETRYSGSATAGVGATFCDSRLGQISNEGKNPTMFWHHLSTNPAGYNIGFIGNCAAGAAVYTGTTYPSQFQGNSTRRAVFFADYGANWIKIFWVDQNDAILDNSVQEFADSLGNLVAIHPHPTTGELYYLSISPAALGKFIYSEDGAEVSNLPPNCMAAASVVAGPAPLSVQFSSDNSYDLQNKEIRFDWNFGDGSKSTLANPSHVFTQSGSFNVTLTVTNVNMVASSCSVTVRTDKLPPAATILTPAPFYVFAPGETVTFTSSATDADSTQSQLTFQWEVILVHNNHKHSDIFKANGTTFSAVLSSFLSPDERNCLEIVLTVTDESGLKDQKMIRSLQRGYVNTAPRPGMKITPQVGRAKMTLTATDNSADTEQDWLDCTWQFGDGFNATGLLVRHTYETAGQYVIFHNCQDAYGLWGVLTALPISVSQGKVSMRITPAGGVYSDSVTAQMASIIDGATIRYTVDGTDPTSTSQLYTGPLQLTKATYPTGVTLKAIAFANGRDPSDIYSQRYRFGTLPLVGPIAFLTFEEMSPLSIEDCSANFINITSLGVNQNAAGKYGNAADFGSSNSSIQLQLGTTTITQLTATMWIKAAAFSQMATLLTIGDVNLQYFPSNAQLVLSNGNGGDFCIGTATLTPNTWHSIGVVVNATTCDFIIDGTSSTVDGKLTSPISQNVGSPVTAWIGSSAAGVGFSGMIDQFSLYNQSLSADSIEMVLSNIVFPNSPPRVQFLPHILTATVGKETIIASQVKDDCQPANRTLTFDWSQTSGPGTAVLGDSPSNSPTARKVTFPQAGTYVIQLSVSDGTASSTGSVTVIVGTSNAALGPTVTPCGGYYPQSGTNTLNSNVQVSMAAVSGAQIYFSIDGSDPSVLYNTPFAVGNSLTLRAVTVFANSTRSEETKCTFQFEDIQASLLLHYDMEFFSTTPSPITAGGIIDDTSSAQNDGNVTGSVSASSTQGSGIRILGNYAASLGEQDRIEAQIPAGLNFTAACWMQLASLDQLPATLFSFDKTSTSDPTGWSVVLYSNSLAFLGSSNDKAAFEFFPDTQWTHIAVSLVNGQDVTLFVDGQALGEITQLDHMVTPATGNGAMILGGITGLVDEFMIFSTGSNSEKIRYIMENGAAIIDVGTTTDGSGRGSTTSTDIFDSSSSRIVGEILVTALILVLSWQVW